MTDDFEQLLALARRVDTSPAHRLARDLAARHGLAVPTPAMTDRACEVVEMEEEGRRKRDSAGGE